MNTMMSKEDHIKYWTEQAEDDWDAANTLYKGNKFSQALFFSHLVIEKICKALWIKHNKDNNPPRTHNLIYIISNTPVQLSDENSELLLNLNRFQLEGRYPDYLTMLHKVCDRVFTEKMMKEVNNIRLWLLEKLP